MKGISRYYEVPLWNLDQKVTLEVTKALVDSENLIVGIQVNDELNNQLVHESKNNITFNELKSNDYVTIKDVDVLSNNKQKIGNLKVFFSNENELKKALVTYINSTIGSLVFSLLLGLVTYYLLNIFVKQPLQKLISNVQRARTSNYSFNMDETGPSEIGLLAKEFNKTMTLIRERDQQLVQHAEELENLVKKRTEELDQQRAITINSSRLASLGEFTTGVAHEINNPLAIIMSKANVMNSLIAKGLISNEYSTHATKIVEMSTRISKIIKNLRNFARDGSKDPFEFFSLDGLLSDVEELTRPKFIGNNIIFKLENNCMESKIYGQEISLSQVLINLINNAADAVEKMPQKWVKLHLEKDDQFLFISIEDSGNGIPQDIQNKMMTPFFTTKAVGKGTGLGLSISRNIIAAHNGEFFYDSKSPHTKFVIKLPLTKS